MVRLFSFLTIGLLFFESLSPSLAAGKGVSLNGVEKLRERYGLTAFDKVPNIGARLKTIKIAVLDNGYGDTTTLGEDLPDTVFKLVSTYSDEFITTHNLGTPGKVKALDSGDAHGRQMAMLAWAMTGLKKEAAPQFLLLNANGFTNFRRAIQTAINEKVDIILNSQNWEYGGNFDGRGHVNAEVSKATRAGILWVNAAGNYAGSVYNATVALDDSKHLKIGSKDKGLRLQSRLDRAGVKITLAWNSFSEREDTGTDKDLDLFVLDSKGVVIANGTSELNQIVNKAGVAKEEGQSYLAAETIETTLNITEKDKPYRIKVFAKSGNFTAADRIRITITNTSKPYFSYEEKKMVEAVALLDFQPRQEIMVPADHPEVIAVGDLTTASSRGPTMDGRIKPDVVLRYSDAEFTDGEGFAGTSNAAAYFAGILAMTKAYVPNLTREMVLAQVKPQLLSTVRRPGEGKGIKNIDRFLKDGKTETEEWKAFFQTYGRLTTAVTEIVGSKGNKNPILLAGNYVDGGAPIIAIDTSPLLLGKHFNDFPSADQNPEHFQVYVAEVVDDGKPALWAYFRDKANAGGPRQKWETLKEENKVKNPGLFLEVVIAKPVPKPENDIKVPLWEEPGLAEWAKASTAKK